MCKLKSKELGNVVQGQTAREWQNLGLHPGLFGFQPRTPASLLPLQWGCVLVIQIPGGRWEENGRLWMSLCLPARTNSGWAINRNYTREDCWQFFRDYGARERCQRTVDGTHCSNLWKGDESWFSKPLIPVLGRVLEGQFVNIKKAKEIKVTRF